MRDESTNWQALLASKELELERLRTLNDALVRRCETLDHLATETQAKLARERAEHSQYEAVLQRQLRTSVDENAHLVAVLTHHDSNWNETLYHQPNDVEEEHKRDDWYAVESKTWDTGASYDNSYGAVHADDGDDDPVGEQYASHYSTDEPGTLTPTDETHGEAYYWSEYVGDSDSASISPNVRVQNNAPPVSPTRVGAIWNKFFENVAGTSERTLNDNDKDAHPHATVQSTVRLAPQPELRPLRRHVETLSAAFMAIRQGDLSHLQTLLLNGISPNARDIGEKGSPLHLAYVQLTN